MFARIKTIRLPFIGLFSLRLKDPSLGPDSDREGLDDILN